MRVDRSGPLRLGRIAPAEPPPKPTVELPALAIVMAHMAKRARWLDKEVFPVPADLYEAAEIEMRDLMKRRGFAVATDITLARDGIRNFLLLGTPVVIEPKSK